MELGTLVFTYRFSNPNLLLIAAAVVPALVLLTYIYRKDHIEKEPNSLLVRLLLWGIVSTFLAVVTESLGASALAFFLPGGEAHPAYGFWMFFVIVGLSEEGFKYLVMRWRTWKSPHFNCRFDGVVYAVFVSLGFALWENIGYVLMYGMGAALMRAITAVPGHASFGVFMGACYAAARRAENFGDHGASVIWRVVAVLLPALIHGCYDYIAVLGSEQSSAMFWVFVLGVFAAATSMIRKMSRRDAFIAPPNWYR